MRLFIASEWLYCSIDRGYFLRNEFEECLTDIGVPANMPLARTEWSAIRSAMGRPRRLSSAFLLQERRKLARYRADVRRVQAGEVCLNRRRCCCRAVHSPGLSYSRPCTA